MSEPRYAIHIIKLHGERRVGELLCDDEADMLKSLDVAYRAIERFGVRAFISSQDVTKKRKEDSNER